MSLKHNLLILIILWSGFSLHAKESFYPVSDINPILLLNSNAVVRESKILLEIYSTKKVSYKVKEVITVLNENGESEGVLYIPYDSNRTVNIKEAVVYDKNGSFVKKFKNTEIYDQRYFDGFSLYSDARFKRITPNVSTYPYTVMYEYTIDFNGVVDYYDWTPIDGYYKSIERTSYSIRLHDDMQVRIRENNIESIEKNEEVDDDVQYSWQLKNQLAIEREPYAIPIYEHVPTISIAPTEFSYFGTDGDLSTWESYGQWIWELIEDKTTLPEERILFLKELVKGEDNTLDKVKAIYKYLQEETRYVSVQLGIGGFEPLSAEKVDEVKYGDCKALVNYMRAMLEAVGIISYYTLVNAGRTAEKIVPDFPSQDFNHVILCVPLESDTVFLECTSQFSPFGFLGSFTADRMVLLVDKDNSRLIHTPKFNTNDNLWKSSVSIVLDLQGNAVVNDTVVYSGLQYEFIEDQLRKTTEEQIEDELKEGDITGAVYKNIVYRSNQSEVPSATRIREIDVARFAAKMGDRFFMPVNIINQSSSTPRREKNRTYPFRMNLSYRDIDKVEIQLPEGYEIEYLPGGTTITSDFGSYQYSLEADGRTISYVRKNEINAGTFQPEKYAAFVEYMKNIYDADNQKIILKKL
ncbi:DUF3857 domain-containing transglutaminase family protein [Draconibacterium sediminis]|uniref:DUF3857 domain-containing protein n=1 Tax=Draconibacterium sediminis TaxID=1544798 RepID=A0A0D8J911_9BACT|nr:DUF3857 and transglutaminase domain-containing protein [Draconibacterium sediminis]KJF43387.1 hypothetical protein LH29_14220 [Draconibacterium sediminis]